ncbi:SDR family NAD(P)-dependent oxidoreductase [Sphingomonas sp. CGMCC 1.13654]|uniref:SDR family NAD(P)-dependent oxidoreductase n=1 Tax=Sphingomonas chungangi TaxID=2683589 RepID=A0A838L8S2_9SPHN|nr:SDR family NAD(P)-dependent oxidoreductase [Sphingomonas chungangi]MBA2935584.1 SDR family NAD(P)-dependent oxidoreductase [Sphingomonas chungangi]MVW54275.1 SDR family NAD(P)-dependent oxidoreductase [Sphingomonas chungangi]
MTDKPLAGKLALVTGASRGIGAATAEALAAGGAHVVITARTSGGLEELEERIHAAGGSATIAPMDLTESDSIARLANAISGRWDALDILVMNAAMLGELAPVPSIDGKQFNKLLTLNVLANQALLANFDQLLRKSPHGRVIALTSTVAAHPRAYWGAYGATKAALENLVLAYGDEVANISPIRVAIVNPGATATSMRRDAYPGEDQATIQQPADAGAKIAALVLDDFPTGHRAKLTD